MRLLSFLLIISLQSNLQASHFFSFDHKMVTRLAHELDALIDPILADDTETVRELLASYGLGTRYASERIYTDKMVKRWRRIKEAAANNDFSTVKKRLVGHMLWRLESAIESADFKKVQYLTTSISVLGLTPKQQKRLAQCTKAAHRNTELTSTIHTNLHYVAGITLGITGASLLAIYNEKPYRYFLTGLSGLFIALTLQDYLTHLKKKRNAATIETYLNTL